MGQNSRTIQPELGPCSSSHSYFIDTSTSSRRFLPTSEYVWFLLINDFYVFPPAHSPSQKHLPLISSMSIASPWAIFPLSIQSPPHTTPKVHCYPELLWSRGNLCLYQTQDEPPRLLRDVILYPPARLHTRYRTTRRIWFKLRVSCVSSHLAPDLLCVFDPYFPPTLLHPCHSCTLRIIVYSTLSPPSSWHLVVLLSDLRRHADADCAPAWPLHICSSLIEASSLYNRFAFRGVEAEELNHVRVQISAH